MYEKQKKIAKRAEELQEDLQSLIDVEKVEGSKVDYIDFVTAFFTHKIAALEVELEALKKE